MKKTLINTLLILSLIPSPSLAEGGDVAGAILISFAAAKGLSSISINALEQMELEEWKDDRSNTTANIGDQCGMMYEARVVADVKNNYLWLTLANTNQTQRAFNPIEVEFTFSSGVERRPDLFRFNAVFFEPGRLYNLILPFPTKEEFKQQKYVNISIPLYEGPNKCLVNISLKRNETKPDTLRSTVALNILDMDTGVGFSYLNGNLRNTLKDSGTGTGHINITLYGAYGGGLYLGYRFYGELNPSSKVIQAESLPANYKVRLSDGYLGYAHRFVFTEDKLAQLKLGLTSQTLVFVDSGSNAAKKQYRNLGLDLQGLYQHFFKRVKAGIWKGEYYWGVYGGVSGTSDTEKMDGGTKFDGTSLNAGLVIGVGG